MGAASLCSIMDSIVGVNMTSCPNVSTRQQINEARSAIYRVLASANALTVNKVLTLTVQSSVIGCAWF